MKYGGEDRGSRTIETRDPEPAFEGQGVTKNAPKQPKTADPKPTKPTAQPGRTDRPDAQPQPADRQTTVERSDAGEDGDDGEADKAEDDPLGAQAVLDALEGCGWKNVNAVNKLAFGPKDVPSLKRIQKALDILTAARDKLLVKRTA